MLATKLKVINQRIEAKDYLDIAEILKRSGTPTSTLEEGLSDMMSMYKEAAPAETLKALCWFKGGDLESLQPKTKILLQQAVKSVMRLGGGGEIAPQCLSVSTDEYGNSELTK